MSFKFNLTDDNFDEFTNFISTLAGTPDAIKKHFPEQFKQIKLFPCNSKCEKAIKDWIKTQVAHIFESFGYYVYEFQHRTLYLRCLSTFKKHACKCGKKINVKIENFESLEINDIKFIQSPTNRLEFEEKIWESCYLKTDYHGTFVNLFIKK